MQASDCEFLSFSVSRKKLDNPPPLCYTGSEGKRTEHGGFPWNAAGENVSPVRASGKGSPLPEGGGGYF